ncbi:DUF3616 domain-containing protein [Aquabacterium sp.]|uniref:DUF3616 domain-containing protein n=1 Tax=Aquabacterium sp. TaxID=1872578 RepID=UPI002C6F58B1|nr:DUF3616 domain-containing protein [Aquabacterium sp.]HSW05076.1 DUF3616 domain-containing protein [Aquabacterium sp.]
MLAAAIATMACCGAFAEVAYRGLCDASAAVGLGGGHFVVADDESDVLRIYKRGTPMPVNAVDLTDHLRNRAADGETAEADIEGAAQIGNRIYWISSHARKGKDGSVDTHRQRFFATDVITGAQAPSVQAAGMPYESLLKALLADARFAPLAEAAGLGPETEKGLNIEGLAATADGKLLIGLRNPRPGGKALVVPLLNPAPVVDSGAAPVFGDLVRLDLGGRGIRSMERVGNEIVLAAGPHGPADANAVLPAFALFRWSGVADPSPMFVRGTDAGSQRAEALFVDEGANELVILSDDGDEQVDGRDCKHKKVPVEKKSFRSQVIPLPLTAATVAACTVDKTASFAGETVRLTRPAGLANSANVAIFKAPLAVNTDGAPTSYHPEDYKGERLAMNHLDNGIVIKASSGASMTTAQRIEVFDRWRASPGWKVPDGYRITWQNVIAAKDGKPCIFKQDNAGYFGSLTSQQNGLSGDAAGECMVKNQIDQRFIPSLALRGATNPMKAWGASVGDLVLAINPATGASVAAVIGDSGDGKRIGEGSVALNMALLTGSRMPSTYQEALSLDTGTREMIVAVLPASKLFERVRPYARTNIAQRVQAWAKAQGYGSLQDFGASVMGCAAGL